MTHKRRQGQKEWLERAKKAGDNEYYTRRADVEAELPHYDKFLKGKKIYLPCDSVESEFCRYFKKNEKRLDLAGLRSSYYDPVSGDGDFREQDMFFDEADVIISNPPFTLFREFVLKAFSFNKDMIVLGPLGGWAYKPLWPYLQSRKLIPGVNREVVKFNRPDGSVAVSPCTWYTTFQHGHLPEPLAVTAAYTPEKYITYDNYPAIECSRLTDIPADYDGRMGVPTSFIPRWNPLQFDVLESVRSLGYEFTIDGQRIFSRFVIRHRTGEPRITYRCPFEGVVEDDV